ASIKRKVPTSIVKMTSQQTPFAPPSRRSTALLTFSRPRRGAEALAGGSPWRGALLRENRLDLAHGPSDHRPDTAQLVQIHHLPRPDTAEQAREPAGLLPQRLELAAQGWPTPRARPAPDLRDQVLLLGEERAPLFEDGVDGPAHLLGRPDVAARL